MTPTPVGSAGCGLVVRRGVRGGGHACRQVCRPLSAAEQVAKGGADVGGEEAVDEGVGGRVEGGQALDESGHGPVRRVVWDEPEHLQKTRNLRCSYVVNSY